ncbi:uncharacterized protein BDZ99DRAFT_524430 [Mytilinidion resinicola]|uniref:Uncharacterized protein n=1 Tax=Mytilinidion resinicola TaxID=574789 RepID=A0A6A6YA72_9PEZI|nr:uncharacterized protein BDZ99DRAFT_524430 [Mytilinidion resinicola]KAF2805458.1 hypothetical protein BDZ99DRAFT_524430 [Mytilinidion resinicola]
MTQIRPPSHEPIYPSYPASLLHAVTSANRNARLARIARIARQRAVQGYDYRPVFSFDESYTPPSPSQAHIVTHTKTNVEGKQEFEEYVGTYEKIEAANEKCLEYLKEAHPDVVEGGEFGEFWRDEDGEEGQSDENTKKGAEKGVKGRTDSAKGLGQVSWMLDRDGALAMWFTEQKTGAVFKVKVNKGKAV